MIGISIASSLGLNRTAPGGTTTIPPLDPDAQAFITAAAITNPTQQNAINALVIGMKSQSLWSKMRAIYPFVGGTATNHKYNLKDPRDLDAAFRLVFNGGWTHSSNGVQGNGVNNYIDTFFNPSVQFSANLFSVHIGVYSRTNTLPGTYDVDISSDTRPKEYLATYEFAGSYIAISAFNFSIESNPMVSSNGLLIASMTSNSSTSLYRNSTQVASNTGTWTNQFTTEYFTIGGGDQVGIYSSKQYAFSNIGTGLTSTDVSNLYTLVQTFQTTLGRQV